MPNPSTAHMTAEEVLAMHEQQRLEEEKRQDISRQLAEFRADRNAKLAAIAEEERRLREANAPPPDPLEEAVRQLVLLLGDRHEPLIDALIGLGGNAEIAVRRLLLAAKKGRMARRQAELDAGAL